MHRGYSRHDDEDRLADDVRYLVRWRGESLRQREPSIASKVESTRRRLFVDRLHTQSRRGNRIDRCYDCFVVRFVFLFLSSFSLFLFFRFRIRNENIRRGGPTLYCSSSRFSIDVDRDWIMKHGAWLIVREGGERCFDRVLKCVKW